MEVHSTPIRTPSDPSRSWTGWATRSRSCRRISRPPLPASSTSFASSMLAAAGGRVPLLRPLAGLAGRTRPWRGPRESPRGARSGDAAAPGPGVRPRRALVREGPRPDARRHAGDPGAVARVGRGGTAAHVERIVRGWRCIDRKAEARETKRQHASRALHVHQDEDGTVVFRGRLEPEVGALFMKALAAARETLYQRARVSARFNDPSAYPSAERPTMAQQQADALALLAEAALRHELDPALRASDTRWWSISTPQRWRYRISPASPRSRTGRAFPRKRRGAWRATRAGWRCGTTRTAAPSKLGRGPERFRPHCGAAPPSRPGLPLPGLRAPVRPGTSPPSLGSRAPDHALEPCTFSVAYAATRHKRHYAESPDYAESPHPAPPRRRR